MLINCPECGNSVSNEALMCPKCGYPIKDYQNVNNTPAEVCAEIKVEPVYDEALFEIIDICETESKNSVAAIKKVGLNKSEYFYPLFTSEQTKKEIMAVKDKFKRVQQEYNLDLDLDTITKNHLLIYEAIDGARDAYRTMVRISLQPIIRSGKRAITAEEMGQVEGLNFGIISNSLSANLVYIIQNEMKISKLEKQAQENITERTINLMRSIDDIVEELAEVQWDKEVYPKYLLTICKAYDAVQTTACKIKGYSFEAVKLGYDKSADERKRKKIEKEKKEREEKERLERERKAREEQLRHARRVKITKEIEALEEEYRSLQQQYDEIGLAIFGEKANKKKEIKHRIRAIEEKLKRLNNELL